MSERPLLIPVGLLTLTCSTCSHGCLIVINYHLVGVSNGGYDA